MSQLIDENQSEELYVIFQVQESLFSIGGRDIRSIQKMPEELVQIPELQSYVRGSFENLGEIVPVVDLRRLFDWPTVEQEFRAFTEMIDERKQDHITWVETLRACSNHHSPFPLALDHHCCKLGMWRDRYQTSSSSINSMLSSMDSPHKELHDLAPKILGLPGHQAATEEERNMLFNRMEEQLMPSILEILEELKSLFRETEYREMVLVLQGEEPVGLVVDEVLGVEPLYPEAVGGTLAITTEGGACVRGFQRRAKGDELIMELDVPALRGEIDLETPAR